METAERLMRLERRCRLQGAALVVLALALVLGAARKDDVLRGTQLVLVDEQGRERIVAGADADTPFVACYDAAGVRRAVMSSTEPGAGIVQVAGPRKAAAALVAPADEEAVVEVRGKDGRVRYRAP